MQRSLNSLHESVFSLDIESVLSHLNEDGKFDPNQSSEVFLSLVQGMINKPERYKDAAQLVYLLQTAKADINQLDEAKNSPLLLYLKSSTISIHVVEAFLRCNADIYQTNKDGQSPLKIALSEDMPKPIQDIFLKHMPGLWKAVENDDVLAVRQLINQWCQVDFLRDNRSLVDLALSMGTENVIRIVHGIQPSMDIAHGVLGGNMKVVQKALSCGKKYNINFRNMGDRCATPLYYALLNNDEKMVDLLISHGARIDINMRIDSETDIPLYFAVLEAQPPVNYGLMKKITPSYPVAIDKYFYKGRNVLYHCIDHHISLDVVEDILHKGSAYLVTSRTHDGLTVYEYALQKGSGQFITVLNKVLLQWCYDDVNVNNKKILALHSFEHIPKSHQVNCVLKDDYLTYLTDYQLHITRFIDAVEYGAVEDVRKLLYYTDCKYYETCMADCRRKVYNMCEIVYSTIILIFSQLNQGDSQPPLIKAVLHKNKEVTRLLAEILVYEKKQRLDLIRDQFFRTALHYAYAMVDDRGFANILMDYGSSEFTPDKDGRTPLEFKDRRGQSLTEELLHYHLMQNYSEAEPDPFSVPLPIPIIGYIMNCPHSCHLPKQLRQKLSTLPDAYRQQYISSLSSKTARSKSLSSLPLPPTKRKSLTRSIAGNIYRSLKSLHSTGSNESDSENIEEACHEGTDNVAEEEELRSLWSFEECDDRRHVIRPARETGSCVIL